MEILSQLWEAVKPIILSFEKEIISAAVLFIVGYFLPKLIDLAKEWLALKFKWIPSAVYDYIEKLVIVAYEKFAGKADDGDDKKTAQEERREYVIEKVKKQYSWLPIETILLAIDKAIVNRKAEVKKNEELSEVLERQ